MVCPMIKVCPKACDLCLTADFRRCYYFIRCFSDSDGGGEAVECVEGVFDIDF